MNKTPSSIIDNKTRAVLIFNKFLAFHGTRWISTMFTCTNCRPPYSVRWVQYTRISSYFILLKTVLMLSSHPNLRLSSGLFLCGFPIKVSYVIIMSHPCYMPHFPILLDCLLGLFFWPRKWRHFFWNFSRLLPGYTVWLPENSSLLFYTTYLCNLALRRNIDNPHS
jgi:hypothetical protein